MDAIANSKGFYPFGDELLNRTGNRNIDEEAITKEKPMAQEDMRVPAIQEATRIGAIQENLRIAGEYIAALNARNLRALATHLHPEVHFVSPAGEAHGREAFLEMVEKIFPNLQKVEVTDQFTTAFQTAYVHNLFYAIPGGVVRAASVITHDKDDGKIRKVEMIYNPNPTHGTVDELR
jgi:ketosteroid isomerase-like protein